MQWINQFNDLVEKAPPLASTFTDNYPSTPSFEKYSRMLNSVKGTPDGYKNTQSNSWGAPNLWLQNAEFGFFPFENYDLRKFFISFSSLNLNTLDVFMVMYTAAELFIVLPTCCMFFGPRLQVDGTPSHLYPLYYWQVFEHPSPLSLFPSSQVSPASRTPSPQFDGGAIEVQTEGSELHMYLSYTLQVDEQPSPEFLFLSSHSSNPRTIFPSPHSGLQEYPSKEKPGTEQTLHEC